AEFLNHHDFNLIWTNLESVLDVIRSEHFFVPRPEAEVSPQYKQIIPYVVIRHDDAYFLLQRTAKQTESRLHHKLSLGIGGHINPDTPDILDGLRKELEEEVHVDSPYELTFVGVLNDDTTDVSRVHLGVVYVLEPAQPSVSIRETEKMTGSWVPRSELASKRAAMETWSQVVYDQFIEAR
ncbi:MAG TPA: NUDIX domain-containing protein, partial [Thermoanaerobaculia bacterium]|nr:NUDIX domain-containing protein [Thermoanaerobaculia bacterium]